MPQYLGPRDDVELQLLIDQAGPGLREVALVQDQTVSAETAGATQFLKPLRPLRVQLSIRLFIFGFEHADYLLCRENM